MTGKVKEPLRKMLVHLHVYYHEQVDYFIEKLGNINGVDWDLVVTYSTPDEETIGKLTAFKPTVKFEQVENYGYDVWPFIKVIKQTNLDDYDYVLKLHTKRSVPEKKFRNIKLTGYGWRNALVDGLLGSPEYFSKLQRTFNEDASVGMISSFVTLDRCHRIYPGSSVMTEVNRLGLETRFNLLCHGTMFMARASVFRPLQQDKVSARLFSGEKARSDVDDTNAHIYERVFSLLPSAMGLRHIGMYPDAKTVRSLKRYSAISRMLKSLCTIDNISETREKYLILLGMKIKL